MPRSVQLDSLDWKILAELQADGSLTNVELARRVGLTRRLASDACDPCRMPG